MSVGLSLALISSVSNVHIAPVAGSTIKNPITQLKRMLAKYQPSISDPIVTNCSSCPGRESRTVYSALEKNPALDFNFTIAGVSPEYTS